MNAPLPRNAIGTSLCVVLHDVAPPTWQACSRVLAAVREVAPVPMTLLLVPRYHGAPATPEFERHISARLAQGDELSLHGFQHRDDAPVRSPLDWLRRRFYTAGEGEFSALNLTQAYVRIAAGRQWFADNGWPLHGFVAPAWLMSPDSWQALGEFNFLYTSTLRHIHMLGADAGLQGRRLTSQSLVFSTRSAWRRQMSVAWNRTLAACQTRQLLVRLELHPWDADYPEITRTWQEILARMLYRRTAITTAGFVQAVQQVEYAEALRLRIRNRPG